MNDYKGLIEMLNKEPATYWEQRAADVIEYLVRQRDELKEVNILLTANSEHFKRERDAAVADMKKLSYCSNCRLCTETDDDDYYWCSVYCEWNEYNDTCENWEWRGVQE